MLGVIAVTVFHNFVFKNKKLKDYLFEKKFHDTYRSLEPNPKLDYDENDFRILKELAKNARLSTVEIAKNLNIPQTTVSNKMKSLEKTFTFLANV